MRLTTIKRLLFNTALIVAALAATTSIVCAKELTGPPANPKYKYSTETPPGVEAPNTVDTKIGKLHFFDGFPDKESTEKLFDNLDFQRAVQAYLFAITGVSQAANRDAFKAFGSLNTFWPIFEQLQDARTIILTPNDNTVYNWLWIDVSNGPLVVEIPPGVLGAINGMWQHWVAEIGSLPFKVSRDAVT